MRIGVFCPSYREQVAVAHMYSRFRDQRWATKAGHELLDFHAASCTVAMTRNWAVKKARELECHWLMMQDSDCGAIGQGSVLKKLISTATNNDAAVIGVPFVARTRDKVTCEPAHAGKIYEGEVGTGLVLFDMRRLKAQLPWFVEQLSEDGTERVCGEDIGMCRYVASGGHKVMVDYTVDTVHIAEEGLALRPSEAPKS